ncbi:linear amide C-N hydrolase [Candidatus Rhabdochlamydia sp. T3358]|uniref:linear amide C-N hydrolase n=1 Tax=Candidatus Rhabdochlamydia sp. T3358 TaxID=2099795 RepID=UPI0010BBCC81|nr:linear amide C-N hydrolase [Candidatus Rhabdochlamydia sp. T3358]VHN99486.1 Penicillin acylase precursor [Candidatus Rhabdochlamydia sp. T3358]
MVLKKIFQNIAILFSVSVFSVEAEACTRVLYQGTQNIVITGRSMDWMEDMHSNLWVFPRGIERNGEAGPNSITWSAKYGSVIVSGYEVGTADGINEKGLVANLLYLVESDYGNPKNKKPLLSVSLWAQFVLDNFATVTEAVNQLCSEPFQVLGSTLPNAKPAQLHLSISDATGDSAIFEYIGGKLVIHHGKQYPVMTNSPKFDEQLALNKYWEIIGGQTFLPGTSRAADRFARASFFIQAIPKATDPNYITAVPKGTYTNQAIASVTSVIRSVSVPLGITTPGQPNIASTLWRSIADHKNRVYYFDSATSPNTFWVSLLDFDLTEGSPIKKLILTDGKVYSGKANDQFEVSEPFHFLPAGVN